MTLNDFIIEFVEDNTLIKLWFPTRGGHERVADTNLTMGWKILEGESPLAKFSEHFVIGVTDILDTKVPNAEAVNIVIEREL